MNIICKGKRFPSVENDTTTVICLLSLIPKTLMFFFLFISHVLSLPISTKWWHVWSILMTNVTRMFLQNKPPYKPFLSLYLPNLVVVFVVVVIVDLYDQPKVTFQKCLTNGNVTLNETISNSRVLCWKKPWMIGWTMGSNKACLDV